MENNKLLDVTNYFLENANSGILNIVNNSELLHKDNGILTEENIKKVRYLYEIALKDMKEYLASCYNYLLKKINDYDFIEDISEIKYKDDNFIGVDITLKGAGNKSKIIFNFYIAFYYKDDTFTDVLNNPIISFELYLENDKYDLNSLRKMNYPENYEKITKWFENDYIYAYDAIDYNQNITSEEVADKAADFLNKYIKNQLEYIQNAKY